MPNCVYRNCNNTSDTISIFRFPVYDPDRLKIWIQNSGNMDLESLTHKELRQRYLCAVHFPPESVHHNQQRTRLLANAVPVCYIYQGVETGIQLSPEVIKVMTPKKFYTRKPKMTAVISEVSSSLSSPSLRGAGVIMSPLSQKTNSELLNDKRKISRKRLFEEKDDDSPKTKRLKCNATGLVGKNRALKAQLRRARSKSGSKPDSITIKLTDFRSKASKTIALMQMRKLNDKKKWTKDEKELCLSLFYKSPSNYLFMRRQGIVLAAPSTLRNWLDKTNCLPGLCPKVFGQLKIKFEHADIKSRACVLSFDEMSIMQNLEYSKKHDLIEGFQDFGKGHRSSDVAKYALVFLVRGLYENWKIPIAYFLSHGNVKSTDLQLLVKAVLNKLFFVGAIPKAVVCDQATTNQKIYKNFGVSYQKPFFFCNEKKIFALFDVPHLIKNVRNNLIVSNFMYDGEEISFEDIVKTYYIDKRSEKSRALTKITDRHINPNNFQKMNVSLAVQIFSHSMSAAIQTAESSGELKSNTANSTGKFIALVNNLFDALNSKNRFNKNPNKCALENNSVVMSSIKAGQNMFKSIKKISLKKNKEGQIIKSYSRPPCFDGMVLSCEAILQLFAEEITDPQICFLLTNKLNQDALENLFAQFRQKGGSNRNPTSKSLRQIFRSHIINTLIKLPNNKNSEDDDGIFIEYDNNNTTITSSDVNKTFQEKQSSDCVIKQNIQQSSECFVEENIQQSSDCFVEENIQQNSPPINRIGSDVSTTSFNVPKLEECSIAYFAGYLANCCIKKFNCQDCIHNLIKIDVDLSDKKQLLIINKSYSKNTIKLKMPSDNLYKLLSLSLDGFNVINFHNLHQVNIKKRILKTVKDYVQIIDNDLLTFSCEQHINYILEHMILVKLNFYCKIKKLNLLENKFNPKLRILKNQ